jgi:hypothetical protein
MATLLTGIILAACIVMFFLLTRGKKRVPIVNTALDTEDARLQTKEEFDIERIRSTYPPELADEIIRKYYGL